MTPERFGFINPMLADFEELNPVLSMVESRFFAEETSAPSPKKRIKLPNANRINQVPKQENSKFDNAVKSEK